MDRTGEREALAGTACASLVRPSCPRRVARRMPSAAAAADYSQREPHPTPRAGVRLPPGRGEHGDVHRRGPPLRVHLRRQDHQGGCRGCGEARACYEGRVCVVDAGAPDSPSPRCRLACAHRALTKPACQRVSQEEEPRPGVPLQLPPSSQITTHPAQVWEFGIPVQIKYIADPSMHAISAAAVSPNKKWWCGQSMDNQSECWRGWGGCPCRRTVARSGPRRACLHAPARTARPAPPVPRAAVATPRRLAARHCSPDVQRHGKGEAQQEEDVQGPHSRG